MKVVNISEAFEKLTKEKIYNLFNDLPFVNEVSFKKEGLYFFDLMAEVKSKYENYNVYIEMKLSGERRFVLDFVNRINRKDFKNINILFVATYLSSESQEILKINKINYLDLSGNSYFLLNNIYIHTQSDKNEFVIKKFELKKVENGGNVTIEIMYGNSELQFSKTINEYVLTSPCQTILDLLNHKGRGGRSCICNYFKGV